MRRQEIKRKRQMLEDLMKYSGAEKVEKVEIKEEKKQEKKETKKKVKKKEE